jgi:hypothetical protein
MATQTKLATQSDAIPDKKANSFIDRFITYFGAEKVAERILPPNVLLKVYIAKIRDRIEYTYSVDWTHFPKKTNPNYDTKKLEKALELLQRADALVEESGLYRR